MEPEKDKGEIMNAIARRVTATPAANVQDMAMRIAKEAPTLADLNSEQLEQIARLVMTQKLTNELSAAANLAGIDYPSEKETFLNNAGRTGSKHTSRGYRAALARLETYAERAHISPLELTPARADDFIYSLKGEAAAVSVMAFRGLRIGALPGMEITGDRFKTRSKGKDISGELPGNVLAAIKAHNAPDKKRPFSGITQDALARRIEYHIGKLHQAGKIKAAYSCHDFRHFYAITEYRKDKDIHRVKKLLNHASIQVTESYLRSLGEV